MEKQKYPSWGAISFRAKLWTAFMVLGPIYLAFLYNVSSPSVHEWILRLLIVPILFFAYIALKWLLGGLGAGWSWRIEFFFRWLAALYSTDPGRLWIKWARASGDNRLAKAMTENSAKCGDMGGLYEWGRICKGERREDSAAEAFLRAAHMGHDGAAWEAGEAARWGMGMARDGASSRKWHEIAARNGYVPSIRILATALEQGNGLEVDTEAAKRWQKRLQALMDQMRAQEGAGNGIKPARGTEGRKSQPLPEAARFLIGCAEALVSRTPEKAAYTAAPILFWGGGAVAILFFIVFMSFGSRIGAIFWIASIPAIVWLYGMSVQVYRPSRELAKLEKRAAAGDPDALYGLGMLYRDGSPHLPQDIPMAREWLIKAAEAGHTGAMLELGQLLAWGYGGPKDGDGACQWLHRAKALGNSEADAYLRRMG